jgi:hypothetical protein
MQWEKKEILFYVMPYFMLLIIINYKFKNIEVKLRICFEGIHIK